METDNVTNTIYSFIKKEMNNSDDFEPSVNIVETGIVNSIGIISLVAFLENQYNVEIAIEDVNPDNFSTVGAIVSYLTKLPK